jgi:hypothetical protein
MPRVLVSILPQIRHVSSRLATCNRPPAMRSTQISPGRALVIALVVGAAGTSLTACGAAPRPFRGTTIVWRDDDRQPFLPRPETRFVPEVWDAADNLVFRPAARIVAFDTHGESTNVNALDEVPDSSWFTNRLGRRAMSPEDVARGACEAGDPGPIPPWTVVAGKVDGATRGFVVEDARGRRFVIKTDRESQPEQSTAADVIGAALYHAIGYHVPCNRIVAVDREQITLAPDAEIDLTQGGERPMTAEDVAEVLAMMRPLAGGGLRASASEFLEGEPIGPWDYRGTWDRDLNDVVEHEDRRELRGLFVLNAWIDHWDARQLNTLSTWHETAPGGAGHVEHYLVDFGDILGYVQGPHRAQVRYGRSQWLDTQHITEDFLTFGLINRSWDHLERGPTWPILGFYDVAHFDPEEWRPNYWNGALERRTERDSAWMARIIARLGAPHIRALIDTGRFGDPAVVERLFEMMRGRQRIVLERYLTRLSPLSDPSIEGDRLCLEDLAVTSGIRDANRRSHAAWLLDAGGDRDRPLPLVTRDAAVCMEIQAPSSYAIVRIFSRTRDGEATHPIDVHLAQERGGWRVAGLERRTNGAGDWQ